MTEIDEVTKSAILDSLVDPIAFCDTGHIIRYMNRAAIAHYKSGEKLLGTSLLDCHNSASCEMILNTYSEFRKGLEEQLITDNKKHRIYMRAVRDEMGTFIGYYERYAPPS